MSVEILSAVITGRPNGRKSDIEEKTYAFVDKIGLEYSHIEHSPAETIEACHIIEEHLNAKICKNLFLKNSASTEYFLLIMDGDTRFDSKVISHQVGSTRLSFASADDLRLYLGIEPGSVSIMGLINDKEQKVKLLVDSNLLEELYFCCHPCKNTTTLKFKTEDIINKFIPESGHDCTVVYL